VNSALLQSPSLSAAPRRQDILEDRDGAAKATVRGTHRSRSLHDTLQLAWEVRERVGVSRVADLTDLDHLGIPVVATYRPDAAPANLTVTGGKGLSLLAATVSALMEAVERHCGEVQGRRGIEGSFEALRTQGYRVLHPRRLLLAHGSTWTPTAACEWWPARELHSDAVVLVPAGAVFVPYQRPPRLFASSSDGLAAGNCLAEAALHGLYELIERDATAFGETLRQGTVLAQDSLPGDAGRLASRIHACGLRLRCYHFPSALAVPVFYAVIDDEASADPMLINGGAGCHLDPGVALCRALTEAVQSRVCVISGAREDLARHAGRRRRTYAEAREALDAWESDWDRGDYGAVADQSTGSINGDLGLLVERLRDGGFPHLLCVDLTLPGIPFRVCRTLVPGFEFFHQETDRIGDRLLRELLSAGKLGGGRV
jgi:ribosomal protein S12 methylthiotransferase accessory factor